MSLQSSVMPWRAVLAALSLAALGTTGWSLYVVGLHFKAPELVAGATVAVFDGTAYACLRLASEASAAGRSAVGARLATLVNSGISVYLNCFHADLIDGGVQAALLFSAPTLALLAVSELSWAGPRAAARKALGEIPFRLPAFGGWAWLLAPRRAGRAVRERALDHIKSAGQPVRTDPGRERSATDRLRDLFAGYEPEDAIRFAHESMPTEGPAALAEVLRTYGVNVDAFQVALVLNGRPAEITVDRPDTVRTDPDMIKAADPQTGPTRADIVRTLSEQHPEGITDAVRQLVAREITDRDAVVSITREVLGPDTNPDTVRRTFDREIGKAGGQFGFRT
ncbi:hypothetical protein ACH4FX_12200 [Streptomyces sp. NPDC018019]|uniref:hypothetical protein n=1 Tax=Streptomyces sp. NPDC018019 TaxID=3365030 RepID=UPI00379F9FAF